MFTSFLHHMSASRYVAETLRGVFRKHLATLSVRRTQKTCQRCAALPEEKSLSALRCITRKIIFFKVTKSEIRRASGLGRVR